MDTIPLGDLPYIIGFIIFFAVVLWLIGRAADSGALTRRLHPAWMIGGAVIWGILAVMDVTNHEWVRAAFYGSGAIVVAIAGCREWQRS